MPGFPTQHTVGGVVSDSHNLYVISSVSSSNMLIPVYGTVLYTT